MKKKKKLLLFHVYQVLCFGMKKMPLAEDTCLRHWYSVRKKPSRVFSHTHTVLNGMSFHPFVGEQIKEWMKEREREGKNRCMQFRLKVFFFHFPWAENHHHHHHRRRRRHQFKAELLGEANTWGGESFVYVMNKCTLAAVAAPYRPHIMLFGRGNKGKLEKEKHDFAIRTLAALPVFFR